MGLYNLKELLSNIRELKEKNDSQRKKNRLNIFTALHKEHDEVNLHSRFISYLLSPDSGHGYEKYFAVIFIRDVLKLNENDFDLSNYEVIPNEYNKSEYKEIDILIINKVRKQAIIIENKIFAKDSNREGDYKKNDGYDGQLERYYKTIESGKDKDGKCVSDFQCDTVFIYYLTMFDWKQPTPESIGYLGSVPVIYYTNEIRKWLEKSLLNLDKRNLLREATQQYLNLINNMTNNNLPIEERVELKILVSNDLDGVRYLVNNFKHIKWHTAFDFWQYLKTEIDKHFDQVELYPNEKENSFSDAVTNITHNKKAINHGIVFKIKNGFLGYVTGLNSLSWGIVEPKKWTDFQSDILKNISFTEFSSKNTYQLIEQGNMERAIKTIVEEILEEKNNDFRHLKLE